MTATAVAFVGDDFPYGRVTSQEAKDAISKAKPKSFWLDSKSRPKAAPGLAKDISTGLVLSVVALPDYGLPLMPKFISQI